MKQTKLIALVSSILMAAGLMMLSPTTAQADSYKRGSTDEHVIRLVAYVLHPVGIVLEYGITRPVHLLVSQPHLDILLGHKAHPGDVFFEWKHGDGSPGIAEQKANQAAQP
jgi:hypothetical protein